MQRSSTADKVVISGGTPTSEGSVPPLEEFPDPSSGEDPTIEITTSTTSVVKPTKPTMGDIVELTKDDWAAWTGGMPVHDWSGLDSKATKEYEWPNQLRPSYASSASKAYNFRKMGLETKFARGSDLAVFEGEVWKHLVHSGMDSIAYLPDPEDTTKMTCVVKGHSCFTVETAKKAAGHLKGKFDKYDAENDRASRTFLLNSLDENLKLAVSRRIEDDETFTVTWMVMIQHLQSTSIERFEELRTRIKSRHPSQYPGENIESLVQDYRADAMALEVAGQYEHNLTLAMIKSFLKAGGKDNEEYRFPSRSS